MGALGEKVVMEREKLGMTQKALADASGLPQATVSRIERGLIAQPRVEVLKRLAGALHITVDYLVGRTQQMSATDTVGADNRASAIFRDYETLTEEGKQEVVRFVRFLKERRREGQE
jgi:transcriptional regulator with XRE-family HTH domain